MTDSGLLSFATERQAEYLRAVEEHGSMRAAARALNVAYSGVHASLTALKAKAAQHGYAPDHDMTRPAAPGYRVKGTSTLYDEGGNARLQWVKTSADKEQQDELTRLAIEALCADVKPLPKTKAPKACMDSLMSVYPVGDHHIGMLSWHEETDANYDTSESERLLIGAMDYLVDASQPGRMGCVVLMGDFLHFDSFESVTPSHKNQLDGDSRYPRMVRAAMRTVRYAITKALTKHAEVCVIVSSGNHDPASMAFLREALCCLYENEPRVTVDRAPKAFHYLRFGKNLIGVHHGDKVKMADLPLLMATDRPEEWGATKHRYIYTGHVHHDAVKDFNGARVESLRILPPADAYAYMSGYRTGRDMKRIDIHAEFGEVARQIVTPEMLA